MPIRYAFQGKKGTWFLRIIARPLSDLSGPGKCKGAARKIEEYMYKGREDTAYLEPPKYRPSTGKTETRGECMKRTLGRSNYPKPSTQMLHSSVSLPKEESNKRLQKRPLSEFTASEIKGESSGREDTHGATAKERSSFSASATEDERRERLSSIPMVEAPSEMSSEGISVTGIIKRYFPTSNEFSSFGSPSSSDVNIAHRTVESQMEEQLKTKTDGKCSSIQFEGIPEFTVKTPPRMLPLPLLAASTPDSLRDKLKSSGVGRRLMLASSNIRISGSKQKPGISLFRFKDGKLLEPNSLPLIRNSAFEMSDKED